MMGTKDIDNLMKAPFEEEIQFRGIQKEEEDRVTFLDWEDQRRKDHSDEQKRRNSLIIRAL